MPNSGAEDQEFTRAEIRWLVWYGVVIGLVNKKSLIEN